MRNLNIERATDMTTLKNLIPADWGEALREEIDSDYFQKLDRFLAEERRTKTIYPPEELTFNALQLTPLAATRVVLLGQDPYHGAGQAHGLCFSVTKGTRPPPSLKNIFKELSADLGVTPPESGCLDAWAKRGVLLLNTVLTVRSGEANSHRKRGWERFTDAVIRLVGAKPDRVVFILWGGPAGSKAKLIENTAHAVIASPHPSPLSAHRGFFGSRPFSRTNAALAESNLPPIDWTLSNAQPELPLFD